MKTRFIGPYSSGKTTIINLLKEATDLSTDPTPVYEDQGEVELSFLGEVEEESLDLVPDEKVPITELGGQEKFWEKHREDSDKFTADVDLIVGVFDLKDPEDPERYGEMLESYSSYIESFLESAEELDRDIDWGFLMNRVERGELNSEKYSERREMIEQMLEEAFSDYDDGYMLETVYDMNPRSARRAFFNIYLESAGREDVVDGLCEKISENVQAQQVSIMNSEGVTLGRYPPDESSLGEELEGIGELMKAFPADRRDFAIFSQVGDLSSSYLRPSSDMNYDLVVRTEVNGEQLLILVRTDMRVGAVLLRIQGIKENIREIMEDFLEE
ncbi:MAG: hypothetical protein ABEK01_02245 [Candidatus Nanohaloarchaea archaeon]